MPLAVVLPRETLLGVFAGSNRAFLGPLEHVSELMCSQVTETLVALGAKCVLCVLSVTSGAVWAAADGGIGPLGG